MFTLVRIDDENHPEIPLLDGKQVIGRGQLFDCDDKRISRNHAELETTNNSVVIKALHTNPCFYVGNNMADAKIINQNSIVNGTHGDNIGFLPDKLWFKIRNKDINDCKPVDISEIQPLKNLIQKCKEKESSEINNSENLSNGSDITENITDKKVLNESNERLDPPGSPSILPTDKAQVLTQLRQQDESTSQTPGKRCLCKEEPVSPFDLKKVKKEENAENDKPQFSDSQASSSSTSTANGDQLTPKKDLPRRERCMYGADCYRKNPQHKAQFSHPSDADWGSGPQAPCPYGLACARRDPRHWRDHTHPYGMHPPPPPGKRKKRVKNNTGKDSPIEELIVTGKRARKTVQREVWSGSESEEEDPYHTDDSDDWNPPSDVSESQDYSQIID